MKRYGFNIGASDIKALLEEEDTQLNGVRSWKQLFSGAAQNYAQQNAAAASSFSDTIAQAYKSSMAQNNSIMGAGLNAGATRELIDSNREALHSAYQTYIQNYGKAVATNAQTYSNTVGAYNKELTTRAENFSKLYNYAYKYLAEELVGSKYKTDVTNGPIANDTSWLSANEFDWLYDEDTQSALSWEELSKTLFDENNNLTDRGREFFDAMFNSQTKGYITSDGKATRGFDQWLSDTDAELRDWYVQGDSYNYTEDGSNFGTAKQLLGLKSTDSDYRPSEYVRVGDEVKIRVNSADDVLSQFERFDKLEKDFLELEKEYEKHKNASSHNKHSAYEYLNMQTKYDQKKDAYEVAKKEFNDAWNKILSDAQSDLDITLGKFKTVIGTDSYTEFEKSYGGLINLIELYYKNLKNHYSEEDFNDMIRYQEALNAEIANYVKYLEDNRGRNYL